MRIVFFTFYYPPDLCAGSFRAIALAKALAKKIKHNDEVHIITTHPNRYTNYEAAAEDVQINKNITIHRIKVPKHQSRMFFQAYAFMVFAFYALKLSKKLKPDFLIGSTSRLMTGVLTWLSASLQRQKYYIDLRDIFSETISDIFKYKSKFLSYFAKHIFIFLEKLTLNNAAGVSVVSEDFSKYFQEKGINTTDWSFFPNGVDQEFLNFPPVIKNPSQSVKTILYAGNIGSGQGLETIVPTVAKSLGSGYRFVIIGDGGTTHLLKKAIQHNAVDNVELLPPVGRTELIKYYNSADILFLHLNNIPAFLRVLPSKIFEYAALGRPIVAGLSGYSAQFLKNNVPYACIFNQGDYAQAKSCIIDAANSNVPKSAVDKFVNMYSRGLIMNQMADNLIGIIGIRDL